VSARLYNVVRKCKGDGMQALGAPCAMMRTAPRVRVWERERLCCYAASATSTRVRARDEITLCATKATECARVSARIFICAGNRVRMHECEER
jgi:hypothetical protein